MHKQELLAAKQLMLKEKDTMGKARQKIVDSIEALNSSEYDLPEEFVTLQLCELFHCLPSELRDEDHIEMMKLYALKAAEMNVQNWSQEHEHDKSKPSLKTRLDVEIRKLLNQLSENND